MTPASLPRRSRRRPIGRRACLLVLWLLSVGCGPPPRKPNIVLIVVDTLRRDHLSFYGYEKSTAPFLATLADQGAVFERAYSSSAWTAPAAASLFTGLYARQHGVVTGRWAVKQLRKEGVPIRLNRIPRAAETIPEALKAQGYATWAVVENSNIRPELGFDQGFDSFRPLNPSHRADTITDELLRLRTPITARRPYFLYLHYMDPHEPYTRNRPFFDRRAQGDARRVSAYDSEIHHVDAHIRRAFEALGWAEDTLVLVTADHGEELGERGFWGHARSLFGETLNVPLVAYGPGVSAPRRVAPAVSHVDVLPTLRSAAGGPAAPTDAGLDLWPLLRGEATSLPERTLFADFWQVKDGRPTPQLEAAMRSGWKRIDGEPGGPLLFDLERDPGERRNRIALRPDIAAELLLARERFAKSAWRLEPEFEEALQDEKMNEELRGLGYVN